MKKLIIHAFILLSLAAFSQEKDTFLPKGNEAFAEKKYVDAEADYRVSQSKTPKYAVSSYNLGNAMYRQNKSTEAKYPYLKAIESAKTRPQKHKAFHNLGNVFMKEKKYTEAVAAYKDALRNNPEDEETRYNFALAKKMLKDNPPPQEDKKEDKKDKKDDKKDKKDDKKEDQKDNDKKDSDDKKDDKPKSDKPKDNKPNGQPKPQPGDIPKERLENLLDAVNNEEKKVQDKVNAKKVKGRPVKTEKDW